MKSRSESFRKWTIWGAGIFALVSLPFVVRAVSLATFAGNQPLTAKSLNDNFNALNTGKLEKAERFMSTAIGNCPTAPLGSDPLQVDIGCRAGMTIVAGGCHTDSKVVVAQWGQYWKQADGSVGWECRFINPTAATLTERGSCYAVASCVSP